MKRTISIFSVVFFTTFFGEAISQTYSGSLQELFFGRQPGARAEAMGRGLTSVTGDALSYYYNPAGMASLEGLNLNGSFGGPYYILDSADYNYFGASYNIKKYGTAGLSRDYFSHGTNVMITNEFGNVTGSYEPKVTNYRLTLASEVIQDLFIGLNLNLIHSELFGDVEYTVGNEKGSGSADVFYFDLGVIKSFDLKSKSLDQKINLGTSLINVNSAEISYVDESQKDRLPVIFRIGGAYDLLLNDKNIISKLRSYRFLIDLEYLDLFNSAYYGGFHSGLEFTFLEILSLRGGFYTQSVNDYGNSTANESSINEFTYGFGVNIPVNHLTDGKTPIEFKFDYVNLKQPSYSKTNTDWDNFQVYTFIFNWIL